jgi:hypothetical protein
LNIEHSVILNAQYSILDFQQSIQEQTIMNRLRVNSRVLYTYMYVPDRGSFFLSRKRSDSQTIPGNRDDQVLSKIKNVCQGKAKTVLSR